MSLLTEADIIKIHPWMQLPKGDGPDTDMDTHMATAEAQQTKALKAVAEWLGKLDREGMGEWVYIKDSDEELLREGIAPWETPQ